MKRNYIFQLSLALLVFILLGCSSTGSKTNTENIVIDFASYLDINAKYANLSEYVSDFEYIPIETNSNFLLSEIGCITTSDDYIYVFCTNPKNVYQLDRNGKFVKQIGVNGRARNEYIAVRSLHADNKTITLEFGRKIITYSAQSGEIQSIYEPADLNCKIFGKVVFLNDGCTAIMNSTNQKDIMYIFDPDKKIKDSLQVFNTVTKKAKTSVSPANIVVMGNPTKEIKHPVEVTLDWQYSPKIYSYNENLRIISPFADTVLSYRDGKKVPFLTLNYGNITQQERFEPTVKPNLAVDANSFMESHNLVLFTLLNGQKCIFNKADGSAFNLDKGFINDLDGTGNIFWPIQIEGNKMYQIVSADLFIEAASKSDSQKMKQVAATLTEDSNQVIVVATLK